MALNPEEMNSLKRRAIVAMFSDDVLMASLVLKGGNAIDLIYDVAPRASIDLDFSIADEFESREFLEHRLSSRFGFEFNEIGLVVIDLNVSERPAQLSEEIADFWGGYLVEFKLIEKAKHSQFSGDHEAIRRNAIGVSPSGSTKFKIEISKYEYCETKQPHELDDYRIFVYPPEMIVAEKLRAICQQMPEYGPVVLRTRPTGGRARDFIDIHELMNSGLADTNSEQFPSLVRKVFDIKRVPLSLLGKIEEFREFHRPDFVSVIDTVKPGKKVAEYDVYFDHVVDLCRTLESLWNE